jgi:hypothetical protein
MALQGGAQRREGAAVEKGRPAGEGLDFVGAVAGFAML